MANQTPFMSGYSTSFPINQSDMLFMTKAERRKANKLARKQQPKVHHWTLLEPNLRTIGEAVDEIFKSDIIKEFNFIYSQITLQNRFAGHANIQLKHSAITEQSTICLIVLPLANEVTDEFYSNLLKEKGIKKKIKIVVSSKIQEITYKQLATLYDYFLVDSKLVRVWEEFSKYIYKGNRIGTYINMQADDLFEEVKHALTRIKFTFSNILQPSSYKCRIGHIGMQKNKIEENILEIYNGFASQLDPSLHKFITSIRLASDSKDFGFIYKRLKRNQWINEHRAQTGVISRRIMKRKRLEAAGDSLMLTSSKLQRRAPELDSPVQTGMNSSSSK